MIAREFGGAHLRKQCRWLLIEEAGERIDDAVERPEGAVCQDMNATCDTA